MELDPRQPGAAHPRVSGENSQSHSKLNVDPGSSPRERGKRYVGDVPITDYRLIPA